MTFWHMPLEIAYCFSIYVGNLSIIYDSCVFPDLIHKHQVEFLFIPISVFNPDTFIQVSVPSQDSASFYDFSIG